MVGFQTTMTARITLPQRPESSLGPGQHHVLYLIDRLQSTAGGAEGAVQKLCNFLPSDRYRCSVATLWAGDGVVEQFPCPVHVLPLRNMHGWTALRYGLALSRLLRKERVEIVHTFFPTSDLWGGLIATLSGCPILVSSRRDMGILRSRKHRVPYRLLNPLFDQVQAVSDKVREFCISQDHLPPERVVTVHNGIDLAVIDAEPVGHRNSAFGLDQDSPVVITVANPRFVKGIDILVRAAALVRKQLPDTLFVLIGDYPYEKSYRQDVLALAKRLGVEDGVRFLGQRDDVCSLLKASDLFCLPSRSEGMSNALLEAMACRLPCVATDVGGNSEVVVDGETGFLVPSEQPDTLAARIVAILRDKKLAKRMGQIGRRVVESKFTVQHMVRRLALLYDDLLRQHGLSAVMAGQQRTNATGAKPVIGFLQE